MVSIGGDMWEKDCNGNWYQTSQMPENRKPEIHRGKPVRRGLTPKEETIQKAICKFLDGLENVWWFKVHGGPFQRAGVPDIVACVSGRFVALEVKRPGNRSTARQLSCQRAIDKAGGIVAEVTSVEEVLELLGRHALVEMADYRGEEGMK